MLISDFMTRHPILVPPTLTAAEAQRILTENHIRHLPVVERGKRLTGLLTRQQLLLKADAVGSLNVWEIARYLSELRVGQVMIKARDVITISQDRTIERASQIMAERKVGCLPVVEDGNVVIGIVTEIDLLSAFQEMLGLPSNGVRVTVRMPAQSGGFARLLAVVAQHGWGVSGAGTFPTRRQPGFYDVVLKIPEATIDEVRAAISTLEGQEIVDARTVL